MNDKPMQAIETEMKPILTKFDDEVLLNDELFQRVKAVYDKRDKSDLTASNSASPRSITSFSRARAPGSIRKRRRG